SLRPATHPPGYLWTRFPRTTLWAPPMNGCLIPRRMPARRVCAKRNHVFRGRDGIRIEKGHGNLVARNLVARGFGRPLRGLADLSVGRRTDGRWGWRRDRTDPD